MADLRTGTVTFLFTDIAGSTGQWDRQPDAMGAALVRHDSILRASIQAHHGTVFKTIGDAFCAAFNTAPAAVAAAVDAQLALYAEPWGTTDPLLVRMALHSGAVEERDDDYFGPPLNRVARLIAVSHGGQILMSRTTEELVCETLPRGCSLRYLGEHRLRDLQRPEGIFQVLHPELLSDFPPLRSLDHLPNNLPRQLTSFVGREQEIEDVRRLLATTPLLTLTGVGGAGKTRLSLEIAAEVLDQYPDGVWLIELAPLADPGLVSQTVATELGVRESPVEPLVESVVAFLKTKDLLLILDNCEHLVEACAELADQLLRSCPKLKILATSRAALGIAGEMTWGIPSLALPDLQRLPDLNALTQFEAVRLFIDRATAARPGFRVTNDNVTAVAQICHTLDGIPLAIELAAARVRSLSPDQITVRLDDRFRLLTGGSRVALPRQQTLRALVDWSHDLLTDHERVLLRRLSIFAGGWSLAAAEAICTDDSLDEYEVLDLLSGLVEQSLVVSEEHDDAVRFRMLETLRQYGREKLADAGEEQSLRRRHRDWFVAYAERTAESLSGSSQANAFDVLEVEHDNLRVALDWCRVEDAGWEEGARLMSALAWFWLLRGHWRESQEHLEQLLEITPDGTPARASTLVTAGFVFHDVVPGIAQAYLEEGLELWRNLGDTRGIAIALAHLGRLHNVLGDYDRAWSLLQESAELFRTLGGETGLDAPLILFLAQVAKDRGDTERAQHLFEETLALSQDRGDQHTAASALRSLGELVEALGNYDRASECLRESLQLLRELDDKPCTITTLDALAQLEMLQGRPERAVRLFAAAVTLQESIAFDVLPAVRANEERALAAARAALGDGSYTNTWNEARAMSLEQALHFALESPDPA